MKIIKADQIIVGDGQTILDNGAILINDEGRIESVGHSNEIEAKYTDVNVVYKENCTILPGLIDMHVHIGYWWSKPDANELGKNGYSDYDIAFLTSKNMREALSLGVTTIRTVTDPKGLNQAIKSALNKKYIIGPRVISSEQGIIKTGGHAWQLKGGLIEADGPWEVRKAVRENIKNGADWIKVMASHRTHICEYTQEEMNSIVDECHRTGYKCCVHASTFEAAEAAIEAGFDTIEHATYMDVDLAEKAKKKGIAWVPTLSVLFGILDFYNEYEKKLQRPLKKDEIVQKKYLQDSVDTINKNFLNIYKTGIKILAGTDIVMPNKPITPVIDEIAYLCKLGLEPLEAIKCATKNSAEVLDMSDDIGLIKEGLLADLLIVEGNPLQDIKTLNNIVQVYKDGEIVYKRN